MDTNNYAYAIAEQSTLIHLNWQESSLVGKASAHLFSSGQVWAPRSVLFENASSSLTEQLRESTPANDVLLAWGDRDENRPPQSWWDDTTDPFSPVDD
jgi:hypothetical protein